MPIQKFYKAKKPTLQLQVLNSLASQGSMSKKRLTEGLSANYSDVFDAVKSLNGLGLIKKTSGPHLTRREIFYKLTKKGFCAFLNEDHKPEEFWVAIVSSCKSHSQVLDNEFQGYFNLFIDKYIGQNIYDEYSFYSNLYFFDDIFKQYWKVNKEKSFTAEEGAPLSQKIIEYLSLHPMSTKKEIANGIDSPMQDIISFLEESCLDSYNSMELLRTSSDPDAILERYSELLDHSLIVSSSPAHNQESRYELSLFGIMLILAVVRTEHDFRFFNKEKKMTNFYSIDLECFFEKLAENYGQKLPLIFGKWNELKENLVINSELPFLFDPIFFKEERSTYFSLPITEGGNKEIYDSIKSISTNTSRKLLEIYKTGMQVLATLNDQERPASVIQSTLDKIEIRLGYANIKSSLKRLSKRPTSTDQILHDYLDTIEAMFAKEITFIFYLALLRNASSDYQWTPERELFLPSTHETYFVTGKDMLMQFLKHDYDIKSLVCKWVKDATDYLELVDKHMQTLNNELA